ncbi:MAG: preprotein translocase subunit SecG [bacterium]|nr:preprotein translocase subunit SecG [bacterium]
MQYTLTITNAVSAILLIVTILTQQRGTGLSGVFGGEGNVYRTKRGVEKLLFRLSIALAVVFIGSALAILIVPVLTK